MDIALMVEGQRGLTWDRWKRIARTVEDCGFDGLFRSDHFTKPEGDYEDSLELWTSLTWLADNTEDIDFGPLVTPVSFRDPVFTARMGKDVDNLADGRLVLGVGAGWQEREHETFGYDLLDLPDRLDRFEEGVDVIANLLRSDDPVSYDGDYFELEDALLLPRPERKGGTRLLVGGNGPNRTLPLAAERADEWNSVMLQPEEIRELNDRLDGLLEERGRDPADVTRSTMTRVVYGRDEAEVERVLGEEDREALREQGAIVGTGADVREHLDALADAGVDRVMLQWLELDDIERLEALADDVL
ncbi:TIGR03560 family F420-dependent LLM class oxidoreductase [Halarchaeum sp. P4]|uniref:TIGR03560 family F420-dependent LLM class oxidoreductase n=1 Tax=Halarchaeum sp. P4 TaxID=3421639 RepID=UPI003EBAEBAA